MKRCTYFLGTRVLGMGQAPDSSHSVALLCDQCGDAWGRIIVDGAPAWSFEYARCERHPSASHTRTAGSFLRAFQQVGAEYLSRENQALAIECMPLGVLVRELNLSLKEYYAT